MAIPTFLMTLVRADTIAPGVKHFSFKREDGEMLDFIPGQFITIHFEHEGKLLRRSYSIASRCGESKFIEFAASYFKGGPASELLFTLQPGTPLETSGPFGRLILRDESPKRIILVATGTGVTPYRSMLPQIHQRLQQDDTEFVLLLGVQKRTHSLYEDEFCQFSKEHKKFDFNIHYSRETLDDAKPYEKVGYVQTAYKDLKVNPENDIIYLCGNPNMIDESFAILKELGFDAKNVRREKYISTN